MMMMTSPANTPLMMMTTSSGSRACRGSAASAAAAASAAPASKVFVSSPSSASAPSPPVVVRSPPVSGRGGRGGGGTPLPSGLGSILPPKNTVLSISPVSSPASPPQDPEGFDLVAYVGRAARQTGLPVDSPQVVQAINILRANGFVSRKLIESLTEKIAIEYLKIPIVMWVCLSQYHNNMEMQPESEDVQEKQLSGQKRTSHESSQENEVLEKEERAVKKSKVEPEQASGVATVIERITSYCQEIGHDPAFFQVKSSNEVHCLVCNKSFKLHGKGQITRVKRHIKGEGKKGLSRHAHNLMSLKNQLRMQQVPMLSQIPIHVLQEVHQNQPNIPIPSILATPMPTSTLPPARRQPALANILPAVSSAPSSSDSKSGQIRPPYSGLAQSLFHTFPSPHFSHAMAAVPTLHMLQSPPQSPGTHEIGTSDTDDDSNDFDQQRKRLDSEYNLVHCHCLLPAKEVSVQTTEDFVTTSNGSDRKERRFYVCTNRHEEEGCNFVRPTEFVKIGSDGKLHVMDIPDELLESFIDQALNRKEDKSILEGDHGRPPERIPSRQETPAILMQEILIDDSVVDTETVGDLDNAAGHVRLADMPEVADLIPPSYKCLGQPTDNDAIE